MIQVDSMDGCYKGVGYLLYNEQTVTPQLQAQGDAILRNRSTVELAMEFLHVV